MLNPEYLKHPTVMIKQHACFVKNGTIDQKKIDDFKKWIDSPKCTDDIKPAAQAVLHAAQAALNNRASQSSTSAISSNRNSANTVASKRKNSDSAAASCLGESFHNPYTFIQFGTNPKRDYPTLLTADEIETERFTGVFEITIKTLSPLLTCETPAKIANGTLPFHPALKIGNDVIVPATGVRGALRTLMTILTGGTLGYVDESVWLCQGRDVNLGPRSQKAPNSNVPKNCFLAQVVTPGTANKAGTVKVSPATFMTCEDLEKKKGKLSSRRPTENDPQQLLNIDGKLVKLSGIPVNPKGKREGLFDPSKAIDITLAPEFWSAYQNRNCHGMRSELNEGDLVWLEPSDKEASSIRSEKDVKSIQWARWGREGKRLIDIIKEKHSQVTPDSFNPDGKVDEVTNLFGHVPAPDNQIDRLYPNTDGLPAPAFSARLRCDNLVFSDKAGSITPVHLSPLMSPHPGCVAFYRENEDSDVISKEDPLRGYKVYRTTKEHGDQAPWKNENQPIYKDGKPTDGKDITKHVELLNQGCEGTVRIAARSLSKREIALVLLACSVDWRLGGGKPLGLGHCRVMNVNMIDEDGNNLLSWNCGSEGLDRAEPAVIVNAEYAGLVLDLKERAKLYQATQRPVEKLRYPRAQRGNQRGGHVWFQRHAQPKKNAKGLETLRADDELKQKAGNSSSIAAQPLPIFDPAKPNRDYLYGYDLQEQSDNVNN